MKSRRANLIQSRKRNAQSLVELCAALIIAIPLLFTAIDAAFLLLGASLNDQVCRDAARAAASGPPSDLSLSPVPRLMGSGRAPALRAQAVIDHISYSGLPMKVRDSFKINEVITDIPPESIGGAIAGEMIVGTTIDINPPFQLPGLSQVTFHTQHIMPITYVRPAS